MFFLLSKVVVNFVVKLYFFIQLKNYSFKFIYYFFFVGSLFGGVFHRRCERAQTQQAQYNEFGRESDLRTGPLWGLRQWSGRIIGEQNRQWRSWGGGQGPSLGLIRGWILLLFFWYSTNRTSWCLLNCPPPFVRSLWLYIFFCSFHLDRSSVDCAGRHLSVCPIQRFPPLAVSCSGQHGTV